MPISVLAADKKPEATGGWRMSTESSPYLQLHADNPVTWYPWGPEAFERAREENKPLFISIGYFTCHWCHVMARESFANPEIAKLLNDNFIAIKVDREQRPDIDAAYMRYVSLTRGHAGWPLSVWTTPDGSPFVGATYIPPDELRGRPGMKQLLPKLVSLWRDQEPKVRATASQAVATLRRLSVSAQPVETLTAAPLVQARKVYAENFDELQGGFGPAPKFPQPARLLFLLQDDDPASHEMALMTLERMAAGGINDQLAGGFHRYSTDFDWRVPHFEKMLYDQALLARAYLVAWRLTGDEAHAATARATLDYALAAMRHPDGGFIAALSADSATGFDAAAHTEEGAGYTWSWEQLEAALPDPAMRDWAAARYGLLERGNAISDALDEMGGKNVLYRARDARTLATDFGVDLVTVGQRNAAIDQRLRAARAQRPPVPVDDKIVAAWNGYMITTLALAGAWLDEPRYTQAAEAAAAFVTDKLFDPDEIILYRDWRNGVLGARAFADDYAAVVEGLLTLYGTTGSKRWLKLAGTLMEMQQSLFLDIEHGGFYRTTANSELWLREKPLTDGATLSVNGVSLHALLLLAEHSGDTRHLESARQIAAWAAAQLQDTPEAMPYSLVHWPRLMALDAKHGMASGGTTAAPSEATTVAPER